MYRVYCFIDPGRQYRYYWHKSGFWTMWFKHASALTLEQVIQKVNSEEPDSVYFESMGTPTPMLTPTPTTPDTRHPTPDTRHPTPDTRHPTPDTRHPTPENPSPKPRGHNRHEP